MRGVEADLRAADIVPPRVAGDGRGRVDGDIEEAEEPLSRREVEVRLVGVEDALEDGGAEVAAVVGRRRADESRGDPARIEPAEERADEGGIVHQGLAEGLVAAAERHETQGG